MAVEVHTRSVDGVRVQQVPSDDEVCSAQLVFGVGMRDEPLHEQGVLHALEHVVMSRLRLTPLEINAHVDLSHTEFTVAGDPVLWATIWPGCAKACARPQWSSWRPRRR